MSLSDERPQAVLGQQGEAVGGGGCSAQDAAALTTWHQAKADILSLVKEKLNF